MFSLHLCLPPLTGGDVQKWCGQQGALELSPLVPVGSLDLAFPLFFSARRFLEKGGKEEEDPLPTPTQDTQGLMLHHISVRNYNPSGTSIPACLWLIFSFRP